MKDFKHIRRKFQSRTIREQVLFSTLTVTLLATVTLAAVLFGLSKNTIEKDYQSAHEHNLQVSSNVLEIQLDNLVDLSRMLLTDSDFVDVMRSETREDAYFSGTNNLILEHSLLNIGTLNTYIQNIMVVNDNGNMRFYSKLNNQSGKMSHYYKEDNMLEAPWIPAVRQAKGKEVFFGYNVLFEDDNSTFSLAKNLINPDDGKSMGFIIINVKKKMLDKTFGKSDEEYTTNRYLIVDKNEATVEPGKKGSIVYFNGAEKAKDEILSAYLTDGGKSQYLFSTKHNSISNWEIVNVIEKRELRQESAYIGWITVAVYLLMFAVCTFVSRLIAKTISKPLDTLEQTINEVGNGKFLVEAEFDESEIGQIGNQFKNMVNNNLDLHEKLLKSEIKEREAELLLLQSQINPHFLYNTLDAIYFMAVIDKADDVADMVMALSDTFKLSLNKGDKLIMVSDEIDKIVAYMKIQNYRYHNRFALQIDIDQEAMDKKMLTFILQPVVENAVYHGLEPKIGKGKINIHGYIEEDELHFIISDDGVGIEDMSKLDTGFGVSNIRERLKLFYGEEYDVKFASSKGEGTIVSIIMPIMKEDENQHA